MIQDVKEKLSKTVDELCPMDDDMFVKLAEDRAFCQEVIQTIIGKDVEVVSNNPQKVLRNIKGRSVTVDLLCKDKHGIFFGVEVQKSDNDDHQKRVRYTGANIDTYISEKGAKFKDLPNMYVIYISKFDIFNSGKNCYHVDRILRETNAVVDNGYHEIYVNTVVKDNTDISELMDIFVSPEVPENEKFPEVSRTISNIKVGGRDNMCDTVMKFAKEYAEDYAKDCVEETKRENSMNIAKNMFLENIDFAIVKKCSGLSDEILKSIQEEIEKERCLA